MNKYYFLSPLKQQYNCLSHLRSRGEYRFESTREPTGSKPNCQFELGGVELTGWVGLGELCPNPLLFGSANGFMKSPPV